MQSVGAGKAGAALPHSKDLTTEGVSYGYLRAKRSKSAICEAISSRAESAAERIP
jgi:hypothetical protein